MSTSVILKVGGVQRGASFCIDRVPVYLRFVMVGSDWQTLDALDQPDDEKTPAETVIAAKRISKDRMHVDGVLHGRRFSEWIETAVYEFINPQPSAEIRNDRARWCEWAAAEFQKEKVNP